MENTIFLAQIWGPIMLAIGLGFYTSRAYYIRVYKDLEKETLAVLLFAMFGIAAGIAQIMYHNTWNTLPEILISLFGWGLLLKGLVFAIAPGFVNKSGDYYARTNLIPVAGAVLIILGAYISWFGYFM